MTLVTYQGFTSEPLITERVTCCRLIAVQQRVPHTMVAPLLDSVMVPFEKCPLHYFFLNITTSPSRSLFTKKMCLLAFITVLSTNIAQFPL